ncbi:MAG: tryptophan--tRNA ligase [Patescibacteria group bacterium]
MKDLIVSGIKPTSVPHIGNYIGSLKQWVELQGSHKSLIFIADLHAITVPQDPTELRQHIIDITATYLAVGLDPKHCTLFIQSEVPEHAELGWILGCIAKLGEMERMTQFKDKTKKEGTERAGLGLFSYPALMAADILLYDAAAVPVGEDQVQHLELTRVLARRFNDRFGETFVIPQPIVQKMGARIMSLQDPTSKMSKSDPNPNACISLLDDADTMRKKIMRAVTDSDGGVTYDPETKPAIANLLTIFHHMTGKPITEIEKTFKNKGYGDFKKALADAVVDHLSPITTKILAHREDPSEVLRVLNEGREEARAMASKKMRVVRERVGLGRA